MDEVSRDRSRGEQQRREHGWRQQRLLLAASAPLLDPARQPRLLTMRPLTTHPRRDTLMQRYLTGASAIRSIVRPIRLAAIAGATFLIACSTDKLTEVATPEQITPEQANSPTGAAALRTSALGNFANYFAGDVAGNGIGMNIATGLLGDEMI